MFHVVFGAGQVGSQLARLLASQGHRVRVVRRSAAPVGEGIEVVAGDAMDPAFAIKATEGAGVVYHCMNPSQYTGAAWADEFPKQGEALIGAAVANRARLVCLDNLYAYGVVGGRRTEETPLGATGTKGRVRIAWDARLRAAARDEGLRFVVGRAGDFFGPGAGDHSLMGSNTIATLAKGSSAWLIGDAKAPHAFSYVPDVVRGLAALGVAEADVEGRIFHLPVHEVAPADLIERFALALGSSARHHTLPAWAVRALGPFVGLFGELRETLYQWDRPFLVDDSRFRVRFPGVGATLDEAVAESVSSAARPADPRASRSAPDPCRAPALP
jgi:nucleoside-diphosphate-sugar epimerase